MATNKFQQDPKKTRQKSIARENAARGNWPECQSVTDKKPSCLWPTFTELKNLVIFLLFNLVVLIALEPYPIPPDVVLSALGIAPPLLWINIACLSYFFTELVLTLCRDRKTDSDRFAFKQLLFMAALYLFFWYAGELQQHLALLLIGGSILQLLEAFARKNPLKIITEEN